MAAVLIIRKKIGLYINTDEKIRNLEEGDLSIELPNHSQRISTVFKILKLFQCHKCKNKKKKV